MGSILPGRVVRMGAAAGLALMLVGCATFSDDGGIGGVESTVRKHLKQDTVWSRSEADNAVVERRVAELLGKPLSVDDAVQIALLNNKGLQAGYYELGISEADLVHAGRLPNLGFSFARKTQGEEVEIERLFTINLMRLVTIPLAVEVETRRFEQTQRSVALGVISLASTTRKAYYEAVAAEESVRYMQRAMESAEAGAELARRMAQAGNWGKLQHAREQSFFADAALGLARAEQAKVATREQLIRLLGLWGDQTAFRLPERLPDLPKQADDLPDIEQQAMASGWTCSLPALAPRQWPPILV